MADKLVKTIDDFKKTSTGQMINIHGKDYATVAHRLAILRRNLGCDARIETHILDRDNEYIVVKAILSIDNKTISTGIAEEKRNASRINQTSACEVAETSAIGRALAFAGITNDNIASAEEVSAAIEQQSKKVQQVLKDLQSVSHAGNYQQWLTDNKSFLGELKAQNPMSYQAFMEEFTVIKNKLKSNGVLNAR